MARQLEPEEIVTLLVLKDKGQSNVRIAQTLGVSEGTVRYHARTADKPDGRRNKPRKADPLAEAIAHWIASGQPDADAGGGQSGELRPGQSLSKHHPRQHDGGDGIERGEDAHHGQQPLAGGEEEEREWSAGRNHPETKRAGARTPMCGPQLRSMLQRR